MKLGKTEKFILRYLLRYEESIRGHGEDRKHGYRSQILFALYKHESGDDSSNYKRNLRAHIERVTYNRLQSRITRSLKTLEKKGFVQRLDMEGNTAKYLFGKRKWRFHLTDAGKVKAKLLSV